MWDKIFGFETVFCDGALTAPTFFTCIVFALVTGFVLATLCSIRSTSSKSFFVATALLPAAVTMVIALVNGNIGVGVAVAGAFSLTRFRSVAGTAKEITVIFVAMAAGLTFGMGYIAYGVVFTLIAGGIFVALNYLRVWEPKATSKEKTLRITMPEDLDYTEVFDDLFATYTVKSELVSVKTVNMGSMFRVTYRVTLKDAKDEKKFIDDIRCRNGNLEVLSTRTDINVGDL